MVRIVFEKEVADELRKSLEISKARGKKDTSKLVKKQITDKNGNRATVWVKPEENKSAGGKKAGTNENSHSYAHTRGDHVCFIANGQRLTGEIKDLGKDGATVIGTGKAKGQVFKVFHKDIKQVTKMINPNDAIRSLVDKGNIKSGWRGSNGMQPESCDTIDGLLSTVGAVRNEFSEITDKIRQEFEALSPIVIKRQTLKGIDKIKEKLKEDAAAESDTEIAKQIYDKDTDTYHCRTIRDCDGHTICLNNISDVANVLSHLDKQSYVVRIKNNFAKPSPVGYSDINANVILSNGAIVELQINTTANMVAKERYGHAFYEIYRSIESNSQYKELASIMGDAQKSLYGLSNNYSKKGNFSTRDIPKGEDGNINIFDKQYKHEPFASSIRGYVSKAMPLYKQAKKDGALSDKAIENFERLIAYLR